MTRGWLLAVGLALLTAPAPGQATPVASNGQSTVISGTVTTDTGTPAPAVRVTAISRRANLARATMTDEAGRYQFADLPPATYTLSASGPGFLSGRFGQTTASGPGTPVTIGSDSRIVADIRLPRLGAISGSVLDEHGQPVSTTVEVHQWSDLRAIRALRRIDSTKSDRYGRYRFDGMPPGEYLVGARAIPEDMQLLAPDFIRQSEEAARNLTAPLPTQAGDAGTVSYVTAYYPGVASPKAAAPINVSPGREQGDVDLRLMLLPTALVEGVLLQSNGEPAAQKIVVLVSPDDSTPTGLAGATGPDGRFRIGTVPHGNYLLISGAAAVNFVATSARVTDLTLTLPAEVDIAGHVVFAGRDAPPTITRSRPAVGPDGQVLRTPTGGVVMRETQVPASTVISLRPWGPAPVAGVPRPGASLRVGAEGHFTGRVPPGAYIASVSTQLTPDWIAESVMSGNLNVLDFPITIQSGQPITDLVVTFVDEETVISGMLRHPDGTPEYGVLMLAFSADPRFWTEGSRRVQTARPDTTGEFRFSGLPPGDYLVAAVTDFDTGRGVGGEILEPLAAIATPMSLERGEKRTIDFTVGGG